jgi:hypothetical protein
MPFYVLQSEKVREAAPTHSILIWMVTPDLPTAEQEARRLTMTTMRQVYFLAWAADVLPESMCFSEYIKDKDPSQPCYVAPVFKPETSTAAAAFGSAVYDPTLKIPVRRMSAFADWDETNAEAPASASTSLKTEHTFGWPPFEAF